MRFLALAALAVTLGCDSATSPEAAIVGTWSLQTVNGAPLPYTYFGSGANREDVISDTYTFAAGGAFTSTFVTRTTTNGVAGPNETDSVTGTYTVTGSTVNITLTGQVGVDSATLSDDDTLTVTDSGITLVFKKQ
jgi:hypothetical protein